MDYANKYFNNFNFKNDDFYQDVSKIKFMKYIIMLFIKVIMIY